MKHAQQRVGEAAHGSCEVCGLIPLAPSLRRSLRLVAKSHAMQELLKRVARFAPSDAPVVVLGETGSGKEVIARVLHANSPRAKEPFVAVNVAALPSELLESELFGHGKGAFTGAGEARAGLFEAADGGTLFLDEIGEMALPLQAKLLRVLQDGELRRVGQNRAFSVDVRVVCATHRDLAEDVRQGRFREDLYFRLKVLTLRVPSLRERREDVLPLARQFLLEEKSVVRELDEGAQRVLESYAWPGNVRELQSAMRHGAALTTGAAISPADLPEELRTAAMGPLEARFSRAGTKAPVRLVHDVGLRSLADVEREHILRVLDACGGSQVEAARVLGIARTTLWRKLRDYTIA